MRNALTLLVEGLPFLVILTVVFILIASSYVSFKVHPEQYPKSRVSVFFTSLASIAIFLFGINVVMTSLSFEYSQNHLRPEFVAGFYSNNPQLFCSIFVARISVV